MLNKKHKKLINKIEIVNSGLEASMCLYKKTYTDSESRLIRFLKNQPRSQFLFKTNKNILNEFL